MKYYYGKIHYTYEFYETPKEDKYVDWHGNAIDWNEDECLFTKKDRLWQAIGELYAKDPNVEEIDYVSKEVIEK